jgi:hypothetical protein
MAQSEPLLREWLGAKNRNLTAGQWEVVMTSIKAAGSGITVLHLRLIYDRVITWASYQVCARPHVIKGMKFASGCRRGRHRAAPAPHLRPRHHVGFGVPSQPSQSGVRQASCS